MKKSDPAAPALSPARLAAAKYGSYDLNVIAREDVGNLLRLEHVNLFVGTNELAIIFYVLGMGFTRDPHFLVGTDNMWINVGDTQFHLPVAQPPQVLRGHIGMVLDRTSGKRGATLEGHALCLVAQKGSGQGHLPLRQRHALLSCERRLSRHAQGPGARPA